MEEEEDDLMMMCGSIVEPVSSSAHAAEKWGTRLKAKLAPAKECRDDVGE